MILTGWDADWKDRLSHTRDCGYYFGWHRLRFRAGSQPRQTHYSAVRPADHRRICENCHSDLRGHPQTGAAKNGSQGTVCGSAVEEAQQLLLDEMKELDQFRHKIHQPCKEVLDCRLVAKRLGKLFAGMRTEAYIHDPLPRNRSVGRPLGYGGYRPYSDKRRRQHGFGKN